MANFVNKPLEPETKLSGKTLRPVGGSSLQLLRVGGASEASHRKRRELCSCPGVLGPRTSPSSILLQGHVYGCNSFRNLELKEENVSLSFNGGVLRVFAYWSAGVAPGGLMRF